MPEIQYTHKKLNNDYLMLIDHVNDVIAEYAADGYSLTLRQIYYQLVAKALIPNTPKSYKKLGNVISDGRMVGLIDWDAISDRTRTVRKMPTWGSPEEILSDDAEVFRLDLWTGQSYRPEVWVEKDALSEVVTRAAYAFNVDVVVCKGYMSQSAMWEAGHERYRLWRRAGVTPVVIHLGDHDPSGIDMTRDIEDRLEVFAGGSVEVKRIALNMDQVEQYNPPPNPAKITDSRARGYIDEYGGESWELDALTPRVLDNLIQEAIRECIDDVDGYNERVALQKKYKRTLKLMSENYDQIESDLLDGEEE